MNNTNNIKAEQQTEHQNTEEVRKMEHINNANNNEAEQNNECMTILHEAIIEAGLKPRSSLLSKLEELCNMASMYEAEEENAKDDFGNIPAAYRIDLRAIAEELAYMRVTIARALFKIPDVKLLFDSVYHLSAFLSTECFFIKGVLKVEKAKNKKTTSKAVVDTRTLDYALSLVNGTVSRAKGTAEALKQAALWLAYYKDNDKNPLEYTAVDSALNKVYAAVRRQAKKNGVEIAKSNKATKDAVKTAMLERILEMCKNHEYSFEVLIGEA